ncbi:MAG TPA: hypothetical protein VF247_10665 [Candidatus Krumholzibacteria bacterium]
MKSPRRWLREERGNDLIEYVLLAAFISIVSLLTIKTIGPLVANLFDTVIQKMDDAGKQGPGSPPAPSD